jgi:Ca2+-binding RTX toxin-like protein
MRARPLLGAALAVLLLSPFVAHAAEVEGGPGADELNGTAQADTIVGYRGADDIRGWDGNDLVLAGRGADTVHGGKGEDELRGGNGPDELIGGINTDVLIGDDGDDQLFGRGRGLYFGSMGNDVISIAYPAGASTEVRCGGGRKDVLIFNEPYDDVIIKGCESVEVISTG